MPPDPVRVRSRRRRPTRRRLFYTPGVGPSKAKKRLAPITPREAADHCDSVSGSGAVKLASSAVVPLVAAARGYTSVTPESAEDHANRPSKNGRQFRNFFGDAGDADDVRIFRGRRSTASPPPRSR